MIHTGRHFLQIPGPTNVPDGVLRAIDRPVIDHRSPEFARLAREVLEGLRSIFQTAGPVVVYPGSGTGAWEAAIVNTLSPGARVLLFETGHFSQLWRQLIWPRCAAWLSRSKANSPADGSPDLAAVSPALNRRGRGEPND